MANVYAIKSGNWSDTTVWNTGALPTSADYAFSNNFVVNINQSTTVLGLRNISSTGISLGGGFILNDGITLTCTDSTYGLLSGNTATNLLLYSGSSSAVVNSRVAICLYNDGNFATINYTGTGTLNIVGTLKSSSTSTPSGTGPKTLRIAGTGTVNIVGNIESSYVHDSIMISIAANATINHTGNIYTPAAGVGGNNGRCLSMGIGTWTTTGNIDSGTRASSGAQITIGTSAKFYNIGTINSTLAGGPTISNSAYCNLNSIIVMGSVGVPCLQSTSTTAINIISGPLVCSSYGFFPIQCVRAHLVPSPSTYIEFRDETTNGALSPGAVAPATRMISPSAVADAPSPNNVRYGISYSQNTLTGTARVPNPNQVSYGIPVDHTTGSAVVKPTDVWNHLVSNLLVSGSIGARLKNVSTVQSTGDQLASLL